MFKITNKQIVGDNLKRLVVRAETIAQKIQPGQFVMVACQERSEWVPLAVVDSDSRGGTITMIIQEVGPATAQLGQLSIGDEIFAVMGPWGKAARIEKTGVVLCVASSIGIAQILSVCRAHKAVGNRVISVIGAKTKKSLMLESQMRIAAHKLFITTQDGSYERRGLASEAVKQILASEPVNLVYAAGSMEMMENVYQQARAKHIKMLLQVSPVMSCATGLCGSCRVKVGGHWVLACQEGPEFAAEEFDFGQWQNQAKAREVFAQKFSASAGTGSLSKILAGIFR